MRLAIVLFGLVIPVLIIIFVANGGFADSKRLCNKDGVCKVYEPCGLFDADECKDPNVHYEVSVGNIILDVLLSETIAVPIVLLGWYLWEPVGFK